MKKKFLLVLSATLALSFVACGETDKADKADESVEDIQDSQSKSEDSEEITTTASEDYKLLIYDDYNGCDKYYVSNGVDSKAFSNEKCISLINDLGIGCEDDYYKAIGTDGKVVFYRFSHYDSEAEESTEYYVAVDEENEKANEIYESSDGYTYSAFDYYKGEAYILVSDSPTGPNYKELIFTPTDGDLEYESRESDLTNFFKKADDITFAIQYDNSSIYRCPERAFDECGVVIAANNSADKNKLVSISDNGKITSLVSADNYITPCFYDGDWAIFATSEEETYDTILHVVNLADNTEKVLTKSDDADNIDWLGYKDGYFFYYEEFSSEYGRKHYEVNRYDCSAATSECIYTSDSIPGTGGYCHPLVSGFTIIDDEIYAVNLEGAEISWEKGSALDSSVVFTSLEMPVKQISSLVYGNVTAESIEKTCDNCGIPLYSEYIESFQLSDEYSPYAAQINELLQHTASLPDESYFSDDDEEYHQDYSDQYHETDESYIGDVNILNDRYLTVNENGYWYGGGAHGYPSDTQRIFDLTTGEELNASDFYPGTEDEFKAYVAEKTAEDYESYPDGESPYFAVSRDEVYSQAYDYVDFEYGNIQWGETSATYMYPPYEMGAYASGFISIELPYTEFIGKSALERK